MKNSTLPIEVQTNVEPDCIARLRNINRILAENTALAEARAADRAEIDRDLLTLENPVAAEKAAAEAARVDMLLASAKRIISTADGQAQQLINGAVALGTEAQRKLALIDRENLELCRRHVREQLEPFFPESRLAAVVDFSTIVSEEFLVQQKHAVSGPSLSWEICDGGLSERLRDYNLSSILNWYDRLQERLAEVEIHSADLRRAFR